MGLTNAAWLATLDEIQIPNSQEIRQSDAFCSASQMDMVRKKTMTRTSAGRTFIFNNGLFLEDGLDSPRDSTLHAMRKAQLLIPA